MKLGVADRIDVVDVDDEDTDELTYSHIILGLSQMKDASAEALLMEIEANLQEVSHG